LAAETGPTGYGLLFLGTGLAISVFNLNPNLDATLLIIDEGAFNPELAAFDAIAVLGLFKPKVDPVAL
tara:strand:+ start:1188 stop:1391 length:204 start_codon:yes stop_codon:yes gene_type:complete